MVKKRDGPVPFAATPGPGQKDERDARLLPRRESSRNSRAQPTTPKIRSRRRQGDPSWRGFAVRLYLKPGTDAHALYTLLKVAAQKYGLEVADVHEIHNDKSKVKKETDPLA